MVQAILYREITSAEDGCGRLMTEVEARRVRTTLEHLDPDRNGSLEAAEIPSWPTSAFFFLEEKVTAFRSLLGEVAFCGSARRFSELRQLTDEILGFIGASCEPCTERPSPAEEQQAGVLNLQAKAAFEGGDYKKAAELMQEAYRLKPDLEFLRRLGLAYSEANRVQEAVTYFEAYLSAAPASRYAEKIGQAITSLNLRLQDHLEAIRLAKAEQYEDALALFTKCRQVSGHPDYLFKIGLCHLKMASFEEASKFFRLYLEKLKPTSPERERAQKLLEESEAAVRRYKQKATAQPKVIDPDYEVAFTFGLGLRTDGAVLTNFPYRGAADFATGAHVFLGTRFILPSRVGGHHPYLELEFNLAEMVQTYKPTSCGRNDSLCKDRDSAFAKTSLLPRLSLGFPTGKFDVKAILGIGWNTTTKYNNFFDTQKDRMPIVLGVEFEIPTPVKDLFFDWGAGLLFDTYCPRAEHYLNERKSLFLPYCEDHKVYSDFGVHTFIALRYLAPFRHRPEPWVAKERPPRIRGLNRLPLIPLPPPVLTEPVFTPRPPERPYNLLPPELPAAPVAKVVENKITISEQINFETDKAVIQGERSFTLLDSVAAAIRTLPPEAKIEIHGHTDERGTDDHNNKLSDNRALSVKKALVDRGIAESRLIPIGHGKKDPKIDEDTEEAYAANRRVEFLIIWK